MKQVTIGNVSFSRVICGTNPFWGRSHFSDARDAEYLARFDDETIVRTVRRCLALGINTVESGANTRIMEIMSRLRETHPSPLRLVGSTRIDETSEIKSHQRKLEFLIEHRTDVCVIHAQVVDRPRKTDAIRGLEALVDKIHDAGLLAAISTHRIDTVEICERNSYGIDAYMFPLNLTGFVYPGYEGTETVKDRIDLVRGVPKPFILIKTLGAGRIPPREGLAFVAECAKSNDLISIGFGTEDEVAESVELVEQFF